MIIISALFDRTGEKEKYKKTFKPIRLMLIGLIATMKYRCTGDGKLKVIICGKKVIGSVREYQIKRT